MQPTWLRDKNLSLHNNVTGWLQFCVIDIDHIYIYKKWEVFLGAAFKKALKGKREI